MLKVGVTGGIGAGKSIVCRVFATLGIPVFDADAAAKMLMEQDDALVSSISALFGNEVYSNGKLNRELLAAKVFNNTSLLQQLNAIVHPATIAYGRNWMELQKAPYAIKEAAIFFESGSHKEMDIMIGVFAPEDVRIKRVLTRPGMTRETVKQRIVNQMSDAEKMTLCDYIITNDGNVALIPQVTAIHRQILAKQPH